MGINSHKLLPKFILKQFSHNILENYNGKSNKTQAVYFYDMRTLKIEEIKIKKFNTELGYYNDDNEKFLGKIESLCAEAIHNIINGNYKTCDFLNKKDQYLIKIMFNMLTIRNESLLEMYKKNNPQIKYINLCVDDLITGYGETLGGKMMYEDCIVNIIENKTQENFILPYNGFYVVPMKGGQKRFVLPISNKTSVVLDRYEKYGNRDAVDVEMINDAVAISIMNKMAFRQEKKFNGVGVLASSKDDLDKVILDIQKETKE